MNQKFVEKIERGEREHLKISGNIFFTILMRHFAMLVSSLALIYNILGPVRTSHFTCAESNANDENLLFLLICIIRFGTCQMRCLNRL